MCWPAQPGYVGVDHAVEPRRAGREPGEEDRGGSPGNLTAQEAAAHDVAAALAGDGAFAFDMDVSGAAETAPGDRNAES